MTPLGFLLIGTLIALPIIWLLAELRWSRRLRITLGIITIGAMTICAGALCGILTRLEDNAWYGGATQGLISTSLLQIEDGHLDRVLKAWRGLDRHYQPTYENRARYKELVEQATSRMRGEIPIEPELGWESAASRSKTWVGHWESDDGYWIVINDLKEPFDIIRSGDPPSSMHSVSVSPDYAVLKFREGDRWSHTITLENKYEATHDWFDLQNGKAWKTETMHKLIRATEEREKMTRRGGRESASQPNP